MSLALILANIVALALFMRRARRRPDERLGWWILAASIPLVMAANGILALAGPLQSVPTPADWGYLTLSLLIGMVQAWALLAWPWRRGGSPLPDLLGSLLFSSSFFLLMWVIGIWQAGFQGHAVIHARALALAGRLAITCGAAVYLFGQDPRRIRGPLGWVLAALAVMSLTLGLLRPLVQSGGAMTWISPWFAMALMAPVCLAFAALSHHPAEVPPEQPALQIHFAEAVPYLPFLLAGGVLGLALLRSHGPLTWPLLTFLAITGLLVLRQFLLLREVSAAKAHLEARVAERTHSLEALQSLLLKTERMNALATLGAGLTHDLNNLLGVIRNSAELIGMELGEGQMPQLQDLNRIMEAASKAGGLSQRLMAFGRRDAPLAGAQDVEIAAAVEASREILCMILPRNIQLGFKMVDPGGSRPVDPRALEQILVNLVSNAKDAMPEGGRIDVRLHGETFEGQRIALLEVADTGPGIPTELHETIFEVFFTTKPEGRGTGLGLPSVRALVEAQGGKISLESQPGQGTTFRLAFPLPA